MSNLNQTDENKIFELYTLAEIAYQKQFENMVEDKTSLFPEGWYKNKNYKLKIDILTKAIKNNTTIENIPKYIETLEGIGNMLVKDQKISKN